MKKVTLTVTWGQFDHIVKNMTTHICLFQEFHRCHHLAPLPNLIHLHLFHCRNLTLHWTRGRFHPSSNYLQFRPHVYYRRHLTHLNMPERRCTTIPVVLPLWYAPHITEPHKRKKLSLLHGRYYGVHLSPSGNKHK